MKKLKSLLFAVAFTISLFSFQPAALAATSIVTQSCSNPGASKSSVCADASSASLSNTVRQLINTLLIVLGAISVIVIVMGGIKYVTSDGDSSKIKGAKDTILYAVVGLIVAVLSFSIVNFVLDRLR